MGAVPYAKFAEQVGYPDCPVGYDHVEATGITLCTKGEDEVLKVGTGASAFWIDRYEDVLLDAATGLRAPDPARSFPGFPTNGQWGGGVPPVRAESRKGISPSASLSWFQANEACRISGNRLPTGDEWLAAARGTPDPSVGSPGDLGVCLTKAADDSPRKAGVDKADINCASAWGAQDMIHNDGRLLHLHGVRAVERRSRARRSVR